jgi:hypothetical protein
MSFPLVPTAPLTSSSPPTTPPPPLPPRVFFIHVSRALLARLLAPFDALLSAHGFSLSALASSRDDDPAPVHALHDLLDAHHPASTPSASASLDPVPFVPIYVLLATVSRLATPAGRDALVRADTARALPRRLGAEDLSATAYLDHPALFAAVSVRTPSTADAIKNFVLFSISPSPSSSAPAPDPRFDPAALAATAAHLSSWFDARHRSARCDLFLRRRPGEIHFEIARGKAPATQELIDESLAVRVVTQVSTQRSYAVYYESTRVLAVHALDFIKDGIRRAFGVGCGTGEDYFTRSESLLDMSPLVDLDAALAPDADVGVTRVELRFLEVTMPDGSGRDFWMGKGDLRASLQGSAARAAVREEGARVTYVKLALDLAGARRAQLVEIVAPRNQLVYDRRDPGVERVLLAWLERRGIWQGARRDAVSEPPAAIEASA